jgi:hypothetical protein
METAINASKCCQHPLAREKSDSRLISPWRQVLELLTVLADSRRYQPLLLPGLQQLLHLCIGTSAYAACSVMLHTPDVRSASAPVS